MEQKEAELEKEITGAEEETPAETVAAPGQELPGEAEEGPEAEQAFLPMASGIGHRLKRRPAAMPAKAADLDEGEGEGEAEETDSDAGEADGADYPLAAWRARSQESKGLGRGGLAAVVLLVIFVPTFIFFLFQLYSDTERLDAMRKNLADFNNNEAAAADGASAPLSAETGLVQLLNRPNAKMFPLKVENLSPTGRFVFYTDGNTLAFTYGNLDSLNPGQIYAVWVSNKPAGSPDATFIRLANLPDNHTTGSALVVNRAALPSSFNLANFSEIIVTIEQVDQKNDKPAGPRAFSLDLSQLKG